jgi:putative membrane protein
VPDVSARKLRLVTAVIHGELLAIVLILLCAAIMARGGWV